MSDVNCGNCGICFEWHAPGECRGFYLQPTQTKNITDGEERSLEKVARLRGECGRLRAAIVEATEIVPFDGAEAHRILVEALATPFSEEQG